MNKAFTEYSLAATSIGNDYYEIAAVYLKMYLCGKVKLEYEIGCALGNLRTDMQKSFLEVILERLPDKMVTVKLEISNKGEYDFIPDFIYALLVYVSGYNTDSEIKISGINTEDYSDDE